MKPKNYGKDISSVTTPVKFHLPDGSSQSFKNSMEAQQWFNQNYGSGYSMVDYVPTQGDSEHPIELGEVVVTAPAPKSKSTPSRRGVDMFIGANYSPRFNAASARLGMNPLNWPKHIPKSYWDSDTHKAIHEGNNIAAGMASAPFVAYGAAEYALPWLAENVAPYLSARGWLGATQVAGNTPAWLTPTSATAIDAILAGSATGASINDMRENGPTVSNVLGTALGVGGLAYEAAPTIMEGYTAARNMAKPAIVGMKMRSIPLEKTQPTEFPLNVGWGPRQTVSVTHKSDQAYPLSLYNEQRWDVLNEGANPLGIWFQGKFGIPRSVNTGATPTKAQKALRARQLFSRRPYTHSGDLTLDKPLVTIGDVPNRSALSYQAEQMGADGLIYNNVYDNGYDANQVLLSFRHPDNYMLTARAYKGGPRKSSDYEFFTTDPKYAHNFGQVKPYYVRSKFPVVTDTPLMGSRDISTIDAFAHDIGGGRPIDAIIGHDKVTGEFPYISQGDEILIFNPNQARLIDESPRLSFQERQGIPKVERNFRTHGHDYSNPADYGRLYQGRSVNPESSRFGSFIDDGSEASVFQDPDNPNMVLKVNTDWRGSLQDFFDKYVTKRNRVPFQKPLIVRGRTQEGFPVFNQEKVTPMTDEQYLQNLPRIREMLHQKGFVGDLDQGYISNEDMTIGDFNPGNVAFDSKGNIVFIDIDAYKKGGKLCKR